MNDLLVEIGVNNLNKQGEELCGDNAVVARRSDSNIVVLSDGMGSGVKANILSTLTTKIAVTMLEGGAPIDDVVDTVGRTLPVCQVRKVAYSTFTILQVFSDGNVYIAEFGNPNTFYLRNGKTTYFPSSKRLVSGKEIREARFTANSGDMLLATSDGVVHAGIGEALNLGWQWDNIARYLERTYDPDEDAAAVSQRLTEIVNDLYCGRPGDDATVVALRMRIPRKLTIAIGPPENPTDDARMAEMFARPGRTQVICGCTTSKVIARQLNKDLTVDTKSLDPVIPPMGIIPGVDLVTEGIITLSQTLEILKRKDKICEKENAVSLLARKLIESDEIHFLVGRARNPAHQNPDLPHNLSIKQTVVSEVIEQLQNRNKKIHCTYF